MPNQLPTSSRHTVSISIFKDPARPADLVVSAIPWYPGITVLQAMIMADAMTDAAFSFRVVYNSFYGAFIDQILGLADAGNNYWLLSIDGNSAKVGASTQLIIEDQKPTNVDVEWKYMNVSSPAKQSQVDRKLKAAELVRPK